MNKEINGRSVTLTLTNRCNLNCAYCYESGKNNNSMSFDIAKTIIDSETSQQDDSMIIFELFGGEPFLEFNLIKEIYGYIETKNLKNWLMFATTNGTLIHNEIQAWLIKHKKHFVCGLSLDGTAEMHNINRSNSFEKIDLDFFYKHYPNQHVKMTISPQTLPNLFEGVVFVHNKGFRISCNLAFGIDWSNPQNAQCLETELKKLIDYYLNNPDIEPCSILGINFDQLGYQSNGQTIRKWCGTGTHMHTYDVDGKCYPCQFFMPISAGAERARELGSISFDEQIPIQKLDKKCQSCAIANACPTCYGSNYVSNGDIYLKDDNYCRLTKLTLRARSYFRAKQWEMGQIKLSDEKELALLRAILLIQSEINV